MNALYELKWEGEFHKNVLRMKKGVPETTSKAQVPSMLLQLSWNPIHSKLLTVLYTWQHVSTSLSCSRVIATFFIRFELRPYPTLHKSIMLLVSIMLQGPDLHHKLQVGATTYAPVSEQLVRFLLRRLRTLVALEVEWLISSSHFSLWSVVTPRYLKVSTQSRVLLFRK